MKKKILSLSLISCILLSGCSLKNIDIDEKKFDYKDVNKNKYNELPAIQEIYTNDYVKKMEHVNHNITNNYSININVSDKTLEDVLKIVGINYQLDKDIKDIKIKGLNYNGNVISLLDKIGELTNLYWTYENETLKFMRTKVIVYKFPIFSAEKLNLIFNITSDASDQFNVGSIKTDVFDEIKTSLDAIMSEYNVEGSYEENLEKSNTIGNIKEKNNLNNNKIQELDKLAQILKEDSNNSNTENESNKNTSNYQDSKNNSTNNGYNRSGNGTPPANVPQGGTPNSTPSVSSGLDFELKKSNKLNENIDNINAKNNLIDKLNKKENVTGNEKNQSKQNDNINENSVNNKNSNENKDVLKIASIYKKTINQERINISVLKESGMVVVNVDKSTEKKIDVVLESITTNIMSNMIIMDLYIVEVNSNKLKELKSTLAKTKVDGQNVTKTNLDGSGLTFSKDTIGAALADLGATSDGSVINGLINYTTENGKSKILTNPKILSIPNVPSRIKSAIDYPYLNIKSFGGTDNGPEMNIEFIHQGTDIALLSNVYGDDIFISLGVKLNKYLGNQSLNAGTLGVFDVPIQSPRTLNTTFRMKVGEISILGGMNSLEYQNNSNFQSLILPTKVGTELKESELLIIASPRLIKYKRI